MLFWTYANSKLGDQHLLANEEVKEQTPATYAATQKKSDPNKTS